ncbi:MAG: valine--tRNA ligase [Candidatus Micrarchaeota archaeon]
MLGKLEPAKLEKKWEKAWEDLRVHHFDEKDAKAADPKKRPYVIDTPPPFPTGEFHTGSTLNWGYIDFAARYKRMKGFNVLFPQGWDCHGFPTETKVEKKYGKLPRDEFRRRCLEWTHEMVASIRAQMRQMGFSIDWRHEYYTIEPEYHRKVQLSLLRMFRAGKVYKARHPVLFCTNCESAIAKAETEEAQREGTLNYVKFSADGKDLLIATTRPELIHACVGIAFHPQDERHRHLEGKIAITPVFKRPVRIYADPAVDPNFGTGVVMICTFGDSQDVLWAYKYNLPVIEAFDEKGRMKNASPEYDGLHASKARIKIIEDMQALGLVTRQDKLQQTVKVHDRCKKPVELLRSNQWFIKVKDSKQEILKAARSMKWHPPHHLQLLVDWTEGLEWDWCISRQRVWGIPVPFWYCAECEHIYAPEDKDLPADPAAQAFKHKKKCDCGGEIVGETSICDGWVDSSITPLIVSKWQEDDKLFKRLYPTAMRPQGTDIIRTWAFYTIFRCNELTGSPPFGEMLVNGMVLGTDGKKMSKSLGNYVEAKDVIAKSSVDALRQWIALSGSTGKDNVFYWKDVHYAQSFLTKLWNASSFAAKNLEGYDDAKQRTDAIKHLRATDKWILSRLNSTVKLATEKMDNYDYYEAIVAIQSFFWKEFCDYYLEEVKHRTYGTDVKDAQSKAAAQYCLRTVLLQTLKMLAPFACYTTEEIYQHIFPEDAKKTRSIHLSPWPEAQDTLINPDAEKIAGALHEILSQIRRFKAANKLALNEPVESVEIRVPAELFSRMPEIEDEILATGKAKALELKEAKDGLVSVEVRV